MIRTRIPLVLAATLLMCPRVMLAQIEERTIFSDDAAGSNAVSNQSQHETSNQLHP